MCCCLGGIAFKNKTFWLAVWDIFGGKVYQERVYQLGGYINREVHQSGECINKGHQSGGLK